MGTPTEPKVRAPRRAQVLEMLRAGKTPRQIQREMDISNARVYQHITELRRLGLYP